MRRCRVVSKCLVVLTVVTAVLSGPAAASATSRRTGGGGARSGPLHGATSVTTTFHYGADPLQTVTVYTGPRPNGAAVVLVHGGGFTSSAKEALQLSTNARSLVSFGDTVFVVNYRDDGGGLGIADQVADVVAGVEWTIADAPEVGADPADVSIIGGSSGGLLAEDAAEQLDTAAPGTVHAVVSLSGTADFATAIAYWSGLGGSLAAQHLKGLVATLGCTVTKKKHVATYSCPSALESAYSPDQQVTPTDCAAHWLILNGMTEEQPTSQAVAMDDALVAQGCPETLDLFPDSAHGYDYWTNRLHEIQSVITAP